MNRWPTRGRRRAVAIVLTLLALILALVGTGAVTASLELNLTDVGEPQTIGEVGSESEAAGESQLLLRQDGRYELSVDVGLNREKIRTIHGAWTVSDQGVLLTQQARDPRKPAFVLTHQVPTGWPRPGRPG